MWLSMFRIDQPVAETSTCQHTTLTIDRHPCPRRDSNPQSQQASSHRTKPLERTVTGIGICQTLPPKNGRLHLIKWRNPYFLRPQHEGFETGYEIKKNWSAYIYIYHFIFKSIARFCRQPARNQEHSDMVGCLVEGTVMSQCNSLSTVTTVTSHQKIAQSQAATDIKQNEHSLPTSTHLPWNLQSPFHHYMTSWKHFLFV